MPTAPLKPCPQPGCPERMPCPIHARLQALAKEHARSNRTVRRWYYRARWVHPEWGLRAQVLSEHPWCVVCYQTGVLEPATEIDHILPHRGNADLFWNPDNLQGLCAPCHHRKTGHGA